MRKANRDTLDGMIRKRLAEARMSDHDRERAAHALRDAEAIVDTLVWVKEKAASFGALLLNPGLKH